MRILAVDDDSTMLDILSGVAEVAGYTNLTLASSGKEALQLIARSPNPYDCLLLDIQMPEMDGIQLCKEIRAVTGYDETPIIMVTAMSDKGHVETAFAAGATDYVLKPFDVLELGARIKMSERLIKNRAELKEKAALATRIQNELNSKYSKAYVSPFTARDIQGLIDFDGFERKLTMFNKRELKNSSVYAIKIASANKILGQLLTSEHRQLIQEVTAAIAESLPAVDSIIAYRGNGIFVCACKGTNRNSGINLEQNLSRLIDNIKVPDSGIHNRNIRVSVGRSVPRVMSSPQPLTMIAEAIEGAGKNRYRATVRTAEALN